MRRSEEIMHYPLHQATTRIGRGVNNDIAFPEAERQISRFHALVENRKDTFWLRDLTGHGILVNQESQREVVLNEGDVFSVGQWELVFRLQSQAQNQPTIIQRDADTLPMIENSPAIQVGLLSFEQDGRQRELQLEQGAIQIGSSTQAEICINNSYISGFHCRIFYKQGRYHIRDLESRNGVWLNGIKVVEAEIPDQAEIYLGKFPLQFRYLSVVETETPDMEIPGFAGIVSQDAAMERLFTLIKRMADNDLPVFIQGESGVGKELVARALHNESSRRSLPFVAFNCGAISHDLIGSFLFGHEKGAFTGASQARVGAFEEAGEGTLFLDEIGDMPLEQQVALLRVLEGGSFRRVGGVQEKISAARVITATHRNLAEGVREGWFREDLFYRISVLQLPIPPLRERPGDILLLADFFLQHFAGQRGLRFSEAARAKLQVYGWPGNVRELRNTIQRALVMTNGLDIGPDDIMLQAVSFAGGGNSTQEPSPVSLEETEKQTILQALEASKWVVSDAAKILSISRSSLYNKMKRLNIEHRK